jgi:hypothetical protein
MDLLPFTQRQRSLCSIAPHSRETTTHILDRTILPSLSFPPDQMSKMELFERPASKLNASDSVREGLNTYLEEAPLIIEDLEVFARIYPFIRGASLFSDPMRNP